MLFSSLLFYRQMLYSTANTMISRRAGCRRLLLIPLFRHYGAQGYIFISDARYYMLITSLHAAFLMAFQILS